MPTCGKAEVADEIGKKTEHLKCKITELEPNRTRISEACKAA
jgi:hypothetical protein